MPEFPPDYFENGKDKKDKGKRRIPRWPKPSKLQYVLALAVLVGSIVTAVAAPGLLSNVINTSLQVEAPQQVSISLSSWPSTVTKGINYTFALNINNDNPAMPVKWVFNFTRGDGIQSGDIDIYMEDPMAPDGYTKLTKVVTGGKLMLVSDRFTLPGGSSVKNFLIISNREGSYSVAIALTD